MNISLVKASGALTNKAYEQMATMLSEGIVQTTGNFVACSNPDIVHVFGDYDNNTMCALKRCEEIKIPTLLTPCSGLSAYADSGRDLQGGKSSHIKRNVATLASAVHVAGNNERDAVLSIVPNAKMEVIYNAAITSLTNSGKMTSKFLHLYQDIVDRHEERIQGHIAQDITKASIQQAEVSKVCSRLLYTKYLYERGLLDNNALHNIATMLTITQYDEDELAQVIKRLDMHKFTAALLALLAERGLLTEGFMPIEPSKHPLEIKTIAPLKTTTI